MTETQKRNSSLFPGVTVFPELQKQKIREHNRPSEEKPISGEPQTLREKMQRKGWVVL